MSSNTVTEPMPIPFIPLEPGEKNIVQSVLMYTNWISIILSLFTLVTYATFKRDFPRSMPLWLSFSALLLHFFLLLGPMGGFSFLESQTGLCIFQGIGIQFSSVLCYCWLCCIAVHLYMVVVLRYTNAQVKNYVTWIYCVAFGVPVVFTIVPMVRLQFISRGFWCWITENNNGAWEFGAYYAPLVLIVLITSYCWLMVLVKVLEVANYRLKTSGYIIQTSIGILLFLASLLMQFIHRVIILAHNERDSFTLEVTHALTNSSIGIFVFLIFGFTYDNVMLYRDLCRCSIRTFEPTVDEDTESFDPTRTTAPPTSPPTPQAKSTSVTAFTPMKNSPYTGYATTGSFDMTTDEQDIQGKY